LVAGTRRASVARGLASKWTHGEHDLEAAMAIREVEETIRHMYCSDRQMDSVNDKFD